VGHVGAPLRVCPLWMQNEHSLNVRNFIILNTVIEMCQIIFDENFSRFIQRETLPKMLKRQIRIRAQSKM
jgi:hypothetical protein